MATYHPIVELKIGGRTFNARPQHIMELTETTRYGLSTVTIKLIDPTFVELEKAIIEADKDQRVIEYRWGYPDDQAYTAWRRFTPLTIEPDISTSGYLLTITGQPTPVRSVTTVEPRTFKGKISEVMQQIVDELNNKVSRNGEKEIKRAFIEETDDDGNADKVWTTNKLSLLQFIRQALQPIAVSKHTHKSGYIFSIDSVGDLHFHTPGYKPSLSREYRTFTCMFGLPGNVISFRPNYNTPQVAMGGRGWVASTYDPLKKQFYQKAINRKTVSTEDHHKRTSTPPPDETNPSNTKSAEVYYHEPSSVSESLRSAGKQTVKKSIDRTANNWRLLNTRVQGATLELAGKPELVDFNQTEQYCNVEVVLPDFITDPMTGREITSAGKHLHWTSGQYQIIEVTHSILGTHNISVQLARGTAPDGAADSKSSHQK